MFNSEEREFKKFKEINREHRRANIKSVLYYSVYYPVSEVIQALGIGLDCMVWRKRNDPGIYNDLGT